MTGIERNIEITAEPTVVFGNLSHWANLPRWSTITHKHNGVDRCTGVGQEFDQTIRVAGLPLDTHWRVTEFKPPRSIAYEVTAVAGGRMTMRQRVIPVEGGSRVELEIDYELPAGLLGELLDRLYVERRNQREAEHSLHNLKDLIEGGTG